MTEMWWVNPKPYMYHLKTLYSEVSVTWDVAYINHHRIHNPHSYMLMNLGIGAKFKMIIVDQEDRTAVMLDESCEVLGDFPVWNADEDDLDKLYEYIYNPPGGQEHRVIIDDLNAHNRERVFEIAKLQRDNPEIIFHLHGSFSFGAMFGQGFCAVDYHPTGDANLGVIVLPSGKRVRNLHNGEVSKELQDAAFWVSTLGFKVTDLFDRSNRIKFNILSAAWASQHFGELPSVKPLRYIPTSDTVGLEVLKRNTPLVRTGLPVQSSDKKACDFCSLWNNCRYYREGSVCTLPDSDYTKISEDLGTRDAFSIARGISGLLSINIERIEEARNAEKQSAKIKKQYLEDVADEDPGAAILLMAKGKSGSVDPELTKLIDSTVKHGIALANLYKVSNDNGKPKITITVTGGSGEEISGDLSAPPAITRELAARAVAEIEASGVAREDISEEHINAWMAENVIEGEVE